MAPYRYETEDGAEYLRPTVLMVDADSPLFRAVVIRRQTLVCVEPEHDALLRGEGMLAGPLVSEETGEVVGMPAGGRLTLLAWFTLSALSPPSLSRRFILWRFAPASRPLMLSVSRCS